MAKVSDETIAAAASGAGFPPDKVAMAVAVALAESGGDATALNTSNTNGTRDHGLWQINSIHKADLASGDWRNPADNARMAFNVYRRAGNSFAPWVAWKNGRHLPFMARAQAAASKVTNGAVGDNGDGLFTNLPTGLPDFGLGELKDGLKKAIDVVTDRDTWVRAGMLALGALVLIVGVFALVWSFGGRASAKAAVTAINPLSKVKGKKK